jgi:ribonuclease HI
MTSKILIKFDGGSRGNPGISGAGAVIYEDGVEVACVSIFVGSNSTNNEAEYTGLIEGLKLAVFFGYKNIDVEGDSMLVINQVTKMWKCKSINLKPLMEEVLKLSSKKNFDSITFTHTYRRYNIRADELANKAMDDYT